MKYWSVPVLAVVAASIASAQQPAPDVVLTNGKIVTVDDRFRLAEAVAITGERILAVGTDEEIAALAGPRSATIDLEGRTVVPGMIDNHAHIMEEGPIWQLELRLDGVETRAEALDLIRERSEALGPGEWVFTLGGWSTDQFTDGTGDFTRDELDAVAPGNPVLLQFTRSHTYLNSAAIEAIGLDGMDAPWIVRDGAGRPTGVVEAEGINVVGARRPPPPDRIFESSSLLMIHDMNRAGLTTAGGPCPNDLVERFRQFANEGRLNMRFFCFLPQGASGSPEQVDRLLPGIAGLKPFQGDNWVDFTAYGESVYRPLHDSMLAPETRPTEDELFQWRRVATEVARAGLPLHVHATIENTITGFLDQIEEIDREIPIRNLRWTLAHVDQVNASHIARMKDLGMYLAVHARPTVMGGIYNRSHGDRSFDMPPLRLIESSGILWGLGSDTFEVNQYRPFTTLWWAVTGKMVGGDVVLRQTISREDALIAHTRQNAFLVFQENNLGSIEPGKLADLLVLDRDYLTVPADEIKDIAPLMTMVGGRIVYNALAASP